MKKLLQSITVIVLILISSPSFSESVREKISNRSVKVLVMNYDYSYLPLTEKRTLIITRDDWRNYVVADIKTICEELGGNPQQVVEDSFTKEKKPIGGIPASSSIEWMCINGNDPFSLKIFTGTFGTNITLPASRFSKDVYILLDHAKPQPFVLEKDMEELVNTYKELEDKSFKGFFKKQTRGFLASLAKLADPSLSAWKVYTDGSGWAQYEISTTTDVNTYGRFFHLYNIIPYCKMIGGIFKEAEATWLCDERIGIDGKKAIKGYIADGKMNGVFYCESPGNTFTVKIQYKTHWDKFATYNADFLKGILDVQREAKMQESAVPSISSKEDELALSSAKLKTDGETIDGVFSYKGFYNFSKNNCDYVSAIKSGQGKQELWNYEICNGAINNKERTLPVTLGDGERIIESVKNTAGIKGKAFGNYKNYTLTGSAYGVSNCAIEVKVFEDWRLVAFRVFDNCKK